MFFPEGPVLRLIPRGWPHNFATAGGVPLSSFGAERLAHRTHMRNDEARLVDTSISV